MNRLPPLFAGLPDGFDEAFEPDRPWTLLAAALDEVLAALPSERLDGIVDPGAHLIGDRIVVAKGARVMPGAVLHGPVFVGENAEIRPGAFVRGGCWIGSRCVVGANTEVKRAIFFDGAKAPHLNYVGDSILGREVNLGAGTVLSNFRHDGHEITIPLGGDRLVTERRKMGAILGDAVLTGCNCMLHPGCIVGRETQIYPLVALRAGVYPARSMVKLRQELEIVELGP